MLITQGILQRQGALRRVEAAPDFGAHGPRHGRQATEVPPQPGGHGATAKPWNPEDVLGLWWLITT